MRDVQRLETTCFAQRSDGGVTGSRMIQYRIYMSAIVMPGVEVFDLQALCQRSYDIRYRTRFTSRLENLVHKLQVCGGRFDPETFQPRGGR